MVPHGVAYEEFKAASETPLPTMRISKGAAVFIFESSRPITITDFEWKSGKLHEHEPKMGDNLVGKRIQELISINICVYLMQIRLQPRRRGRGDVTGIQRKKRGEGNQWSYLVIGSELY